MKIQGSSAINSQKNTSVDEKKIFDKGREYSELRLKEYYETEAPKRKTESVEIDISEEGKAADYELSKKNEPKFYVSNLSTYRGNPNDPGILHAMAALDPEVYARVQEASMSGDFETSGALSIAWYKENMFRVGKWKMNGAGAGEFEKKYNSELYISNRTAHQSINMFRHVRQLPSRTIIELTTEQYIRIHDKKDSELTSILEASVKKANEIVEMLDKAADATRQNRLHDTRVGFTIGEDGKTTYYVDARDQENFDWEKSTYHIYASQDINQLVDDVVHKKNGMDHFEYIA